ncbi:uncharacterized protein BYT42DRAFT_568010 [Radiomyces spectabilis]|uniref:uncharacterized protein n=1 Tax=Radiomyces spectabilis TaxID=64574 RepID=UPI00221EB7A9|nr:uncharacterized protein BYT42DRAFT_568010 [Radiomyces spectabilis]KAI8379210.1 hypothetical protein BYT42DRAFT_568010 [Radiomyces spectabilis]
MTVTENVFPIGYFYIISRLNGLVLDIEDPATAAPGSRIVTKTKLEKSPERDSQLWIHQNGFLTNKLSGLVLDVNRATNFTAIFTGEEHLYLDQMKEQDAANDQRFGYEAPTGIIYTLADPNTVVDIKGGKSEVNARVMVYKRKEEAEEAMNQRWNLELGDPLKVDDDDDEEDDSKSARLRAWFGSWIGWGDKKREVLNEQELGEAHKKVYKEKKSHVSYELLAGAAAFEAVRAWEKKKEESGEEVKYGLAKKLVAGLAAAELVKLFQERGSDDDDNEVKEEKQSLMQKMAAKAATNYFESKYSS